MPVVDASKLEATVRVVSTVAPVTAADLFDDAAMAAGYATDRPPVHPHLVDRLRASWNPAAPVRVAVDVGCGAGASTAALRGWVGRPRRARSVRAR